jgi:hypothetical protein
MLVAKLALRALLLCNLTTAAAAQPNWERLSGFQFNWNGRVNVRVVLERPVPWKEAGDFTRIRILVPGEKPLVLKTDTSWENFHDDPGNISREVLKSKNLVPSHYVLAVNASGDRRTLLILFGYAFGSSPGSLDIIELPPIGGPRVALHRDELSLHSLTDLDSDGTAELVTAPCFSQAWGDNLLTYDPYNVYKLGQVPGEPAQISLALSKDYNLAHYYGWAGIACSEKLAIVLHPPGGGKPRMLPSKEAEALMMRGSSAKQRSTH